MPLRMPHFPKLPFNRFELAWFGSAALSIFVPLIVMGSAKIANRNNYNNYQQQQQDGDGAQQYNNNCKWWQWGCNNSYYNNQQEEEQEGQGDDNERSTPWWWFFASEEDRRRREESQSNNPAMIFCYVWSLCLFCGIVYFGYREIRNKSDLYRVVAALFVFGNWAFLSMFLIGGLEGGVQTDGPELEEQGFYSQFGVMMFFTNLFWTIYAIVFGALFYRAAKNDDVIKIDVDESDYQIHNPETRTTTQKSDVV